MCTIDENESTNMCSSNIYYNTNVYTETYVCNYVCVWGGEVMDGLYFLNKLHQI